MQPQAKAFIEGESQAWIKRNAHKLPTKNDPVLAAIEFYKITPQSVLEIGCANGWRLDAMRQKYDCDILGFDPAPAPPVPTLGNGIADKNHIDYWIMRGTADALPPHLSNKFDLVIVGFCLYLVDREDLFRAVAEADRVLKPGGHVIVYDFYTDAPHSRVYHHLPHLKTFKMNYEKLWLANPGYALVGRQISSCEVGKTPATSSLTNPDDLTQVAILKKLPTDTAWPLKK